MIQKTTGFRASDGALYDKLEDAKRAELRKLLYETVDAGSFQEGLLESFADGILKEAARYIDILSTGPKSRPARRAVNGGTTKRRRPTAPVFRGLGTSKEEVVAEFNKHAATAREAMEARVAARAATPEQASEGFAAMRTAANGEVEPAP